MSNKLKEKIETEENLKLLICAVNPNLYKELNKESNDIQENDVVVNENLEEDIKALRPDITETEIKKIKEKLYA